MTENTGIPPVDDGDFVFACRITVDKHQSSEQAHEAVELLLAGAPYIAGLKSVVLLDVVADDLLDFVRKYSRGRDVVYV